VADPGAGRAKRTGPAYRGGGRCRLARFGNEPFTARHYGDDVAPSLSEPLDLEQDEPPALSPTLSEPRRPGSRTATGERTTTRPYRSLWPVLTALAAGCVVAAVLLSATAHAEFPLYSEASAERGRDCSDIQSARHALDGTLEAHLPLRPGDADAARAIRSAVAAFDARTQDIATPAVETALGPVRGSLDALGDSVQGYAAAAGTSRTGRAADAAFAQVTESWKGAIARVCN
jgi:hypothetical protein